MGNNNPTATNHFVNTINSYLIPAAATTFEEEIKRSRFITYLQHTSNVEAAKDFVHSIKQQHAAARHHCWGFVAGAPNDSMKLGFSDDGEPSGTAGKPILAQLQGSNIGEICAVVVRYSGGIKLGTGGLVKAYGGGVKHALLVLQTIEKNIQIPLKVYAPFSQANVVELLLEQEKASVLRREYDSEVIFHIELDVQRHQSFTKQLINKSNGQVRVSAYETPDTKKPA